MNGKGIQRWSKSEDLPEYSSFVPSGDGAKNISIISNVLLPENRNENDCVISQLLDESYLKRTHLEKSIFYPKENIWECNTYVLFYVSIYGLNSIPRKHQIGCGKLI